MAAKGAQTRKATGHEGFLRHARFRWLKIASVVAALAILVYGLDRPLPRPGGGTFYGYTLGTIGALLILWLTLLGLRKRWITSGRWSLKAWTSAHVYLGLALIVIGTLHTGFQFGWNVHTLAYALMLLVIASGVVGIALYNWVPRALSDNRGELTETQMIAAMTALDRQIEAAAQPLSAGDAELVRRVLEESPFDAGAWTRLSGRFRVPATEEALDALRDEGARAASRGDSMAALLARRLATSERIHRHMHLKALLEAWLYVHVPATFALIAALTAHIVATFFYW